MKPGMPQVCRYCGLVFKSRQLDANGNSPKHTTLRTKCPGSGNRPRALWTMETETETKMTPRMNGSHPKWATASGVIRVADERRIQWASRRNDEGHRVRRAPLITNTRPPLRAPLRAKGVA